MLFANPFRLARTGLLGMNERNAFIARYNRRSLYPLVDNKLKTKMLTERTGLAAPKLLGVIREQHEVEHELPALLESLDAFVIKPSRGSGGKGITVIVKRDGPRFIKASGDEVSHAEVTRHVSNILSGLYSLGGLPDAAMIESLVQMDPQFDGMSYEGIPDIRIIVFRGYPVMSMMRLATHASDGKANLHQGAVGVGLDLASGQALFAVQHNVPITHHPDTGRTFDSLRIPHWAALMELAASCADMTGLGYLGADIVIDRTLGPLIMELNARPGLSIQIANNTGLRPRLRLIKDLGDNLSQSAAERVAFSMQHFGQPLSLLRTGS